MSVREATPADVQRIVELVHALAEYEREADKVEATEDDFRHALFPDDGRPTAFAHVAEVDGAVVGMAVWYVTFSTWTGGNSIWLEDLFVEPEHRGSGCGRGLLAALAGVCRDRGYPRLEWWVLNWNEPSIGFYRGLGAEACEQWTTFRLAGDALERLGG
jgi:GNAT superfamily N-acetyltransferase